MDVSTASAYIYAKASGMLANSFVGSRTVKLFDARSVADLWLMLFKTEVPLVPENMLARLTEEKAEAVFIADFMKLLNAFDEPDPVALQLLRFYDYLNIKQIASALLMKQPDMPTIVDIGRYSMLDYAKWPKLADITRDSSISWHTDIPNRSEQKDIDARLDIQYSKELWFATQKIRNPEKEPVKKIIKDYIVFQNIVWAIRLMSYYGLHSDDIAKQLVFEDEKAGQTDVLAGPALSVLDKHPDDWADWADWTYADLLNQNDDGSIWKLDPRWLQNAVNVRLHKTAYKSFRKHFSSTHTLVTWYKIKEYELNCIRTCIEGLRLNVETSDLKHFMGVHV